MNYRNRPALFPAFLHAIVFLMVIMVTAPNMLIARDAPVTTAGSPSVCPGLTVAVPVTVTNFTMVTAISLRLDYNPLQVTFINFTNLNAGLSGAMVNDVAVSPTLRKVLIIWTNVTPLTLTNGSKLMDLNFTLVGGTPVISFNNSAGGGGECEYADENGAPMNDIPTSSFYIDATITNLGTPVAGPIAGSNSLCAGSTNVTYSVSPIQYATSYTWSVPPGASIVSGSGSTTITVNYSNSATSGNVTVFGTGNCGNGGASTLTVVVHPRPVPAINGNANPCANSTGVSYTTEAGMTGYAWTITSGGTITSGANSNSIMVTWITPGTQFVSVSYTNSNGCSSINPSVKTITVNARPLPTISGSNAVCVGTSGHTYTTETGMTGYLWDISSGGTITAGANTSSIQVTWNNAGSQSVNVMYINPSGCSALIPTVKTVTVNSRPVPTISGNTSVCSGATGVSYVTEAGMTGYSWSISAGGTITSGGTTNAIQVTWNTAGNQSLSVIYTDPNTGCTPLAPANKPVTVNPLPSPTLSGPSPVCVNAPGNVYNTEAGMTNYSWTVSAGGIITGGGGSGNNAVTITWTATGAQSVSVNYMNASGCSALLATTANITVDPQPAAAGVITGSSSVCQGASGIVYSVNPIPNAISYVWTLPAGASITAGAGSNNITVDFSASAISGNITVAGNNLCGNGVSSPPFPVSVDLQPGAAGAISGPGSVCAGQTNVVYQVDPVINATGYQWTIPAGAVITAGASTPQITVTFGNDPTTGIISVAGTNGCGSGTRSPDFPVAINPAPAAPVITSNGPVLSSSYPSGNQWYYNGNPISGATGQIYTVLNNTGYYWTIVTISGCSSPESNKIWIEITGIEDQQGSEVKIYPVPANDHLNIKLNSLSQEPARILIYNSWGVLILKSSIPEDDISMERVIDVTNYSAGVYTLVIMQKDHAIIRKFVLAR